MLANRSKHADDREIADFALLNAELTMKHEGSWYSALMTNKCPETSVTKWCCMYSIGLGRQYSVPVEWRAARPLDRNVTGHHK